MVGQGRRWRALVVNATNGELIKRIRVGPQAHNSFVSLDGKRVYLGTQTMLTVFDTVNEKVHPAGKGRG